MVRQKPMQFVAERDRVGRKIRSRAKFFEVPAGPADPGAFEVVDINVGQQMNTGPQADDFDLARTVVGDKRLLSRCDQQIEGVVIAAALVRDELRRLCRGRKTECIEAQKPARP